MSNHVHVWGQISTNTKIINNYKSTMYTKDGGSLMKLRNWNNCLNEGQPSNKTHKTEIF